MSAHAEAAELHNQVVETLGGNYKISTPGVTRGGEVWMDVCLASFSVPQSALQSR